MESSNSNIVEHLENYNVENSALHRKLQTNVEAIRILRRELDKYRSERDQFKLMAETIQLRYCATMKGMYSENPEMDSFLDSSSATKLLNHMREKNLQLSTELERTKEKLLEKEGDIEALRQKRSDLSSSNRRNSSSALEEEERQSLLSQMEVLKKTNAQLKFDLHSMVDDKNDLFTEMEAYKAKAKRLQEELDQTNKGNALDSTQEIDKLLGENKKLKERMRNMEKDMEMSREIIIKYQKYVEAHRKDDSRSTEDRIEGQ